MYLKFLDKSTLYFFSIISQPNTWFDAFTFKTSCFAAYKKLPEAEPTSKPNLLSSFLYLIFLDFLNNYKMFYSKNSGLIDFCLRIFIGFGDNFFFNSGFKYSNYRLHLTT